MTVALEVFSAFVLDDIGPSGRRGSKRRRGREEEEEELKGLKAAEDSADKKKLKVTSVLTTEALRYLQGLDAYVAQGKKRKACLTGPSNDVHTDSFYVNCNQRAVKRPREDEQLIIKDDACLQFEALPTEIMWYTITSFLSGKDVCMLSMTCHYFVGLSKSEELWKALFLRDFGLTSIRSQFHLRFNKTWLWLYRSKAVVFKRREDMREGRVVGSLVEQNVLFEGEWLDGFFTGYGLATALPGDGMWDEGVVCEGEWRFGCLHGFGRESFPDGEFLEGSAWLGNALYGQGMRKWKDGRVYKGDFKDSLPDGKGLMKYPGGSTYIGAWKEGERHGQGVMIYEDKSKFAGLFFKDKRNGVGVMQYADGGQYKGEWLDDRRHGKGVMRWTSGRVRLYEGTWVADKQDGKGRVSYEDGTSFEGRWLQNKIVTSLKRSL